MAAAFWLLGTVASAQVVPSASSGGYKIWAGALASGYNVQYGDRHLGGITALVDVDTVRGLGVEGEARWLEFHQKADLHVETYSIGARYHRNRGRLQPYAKALIGFGDFHFPYNYASGRYTVVSFGGGLDYAWKQRVSIRALDFEYQDWPDFTFGATRTMGLGIGLRYRIF